eukprot:16448274-Heterocapsa_arctica.AAC.1
MRAKINGIKLIGNASRLSDEGKAAAHISANIGNGRHTGTLHGRLAKLAALNPTTPGINSKLPGYSVPPDVKATVRPPEGKRG